MIHEKYRSIFINELKANANDFDNEYKRVIDEYGESNEIQLDFYKAAITSVIKSFKNQIGYNEIVSDRIQNSYKSIIKALQDDEIDATHFIIEKSKFTVSDIRDWREQKKIEKDTYTPTYNAYNPNTKYGRRKAREQAQRNYENGTPEYRNDSDNIKIVLWLIIIVIAIIFYFIKAKLSN